MPESHRKRDVNPMPRTLWWSRSADGILLEVTYGIRLIHSRTLDVESARVAFRELQARYKIGEVRERAASAPK